MRYSRSIVEYPQPPDSYIHQLLQYIVDHELTKLESNCYKLNSIIASAESESLDVSLQFRILPLSSKRRSVDSRFHCIVPDKDRVVIGSVDEPPQEASSTAIVICCCVIAIFLFLLLILRCRSYCASHTTSFPMDSIRGIYLLEHPIANQNTSENQDADSRSLSCIRRRTQHSHGPRGQKFWYCTECVRGGKTARKNFALGYIWPIQTHTSGFCTWTEGSVAQGSDLSSSRIKIAHSTEPQASTCHLSAITSQSDRIQSVIRGSSRTVDDEHLISVRKESHLAMGYIEYYKRLGKLKLPSNQLLLGSPSTYTDDIAHVQTNGMSASCENHSRFDSNQTRGSHRSYENNRARFPELDNISHKYDPSKKSIISSQLDLKHPNLISMDSHMTDDSCFIQSIDTQPNESVVNDDLSSRSSLSSAIQASVDLIIRPLHPIVNLPDESSDTGSSATDYSQDNLHDTSITLSTTQENPMSDGYIALECTAPKLRKRGVCLFSAQKRQKGRFSHQQLIGVRSIGGHKRDKNSGRDTLGLPRLLAPTRSFVMTNSRQIESTLRRQPTDAKSCNNLMDSKDARNQEYYSSLSTESSTTPGIEMMDLPDVYLNSPSLCSIQSSRGSMMLAALSPQQSKPMPISNSTSFVHKQDSTENNTLFDGRQNGLPQNTVQRSNGNSCSYGVGGSNMNRKRILGTNLNKSHNNLSQVYSAHNIVDLFHFSNPTKSSDVAFPEPSGVYFSRRDKLSVGTLKRALSLNLRPKGPKTLGDELQSIMDKHYEMTGIRMITSSMAHPVARSSTRATNDLASSSRNGMGTSRSESHHIASKERRNSCGLPREHSPLKLTPLGVAKSTNKLDCLQLWPSKPNQLSAKCNSVLCGLNTIARTCIAPFRTRFNSDGSSITTTSAVMDKAYSGPIRRASSFIIENRTESEKLDSQVFDPQPGIREADSSIHLNRLQ